MPSVPSQKTCFFLGCKNNKVFASNYCAEHSTKKSVKIKQNAKLYNSSAWKSTRDAMRSMYPLCSACLLENRVVPTAHIDHVIPHRRDSDRFLVNLFQGLCAPCHTQKTKLEGQGIYRHYTREGIIDYKDIDYEHLIVRKFHDQS